MCTWWPGQGLPHCCSQDCSPRHNQRQKNRLFLLCRLEKNDSKSGDPNSVMDGALSPRSGSHARCLRCLDMSNFSVQRLSLLTCRFFKTSQFLWFLIPFQKLYLLLAQGRTAGCDALWAPGQRQKTHVRQKGNWKFDWRGKKKRCIIGTITLDPPP